MPGIYAIWDDVTGRVYVGSSVHIPTRKSAHFTNLQRGTHANAHLQNAYKSYGESAFTFTVIEPCQTEKLIEREQFWIDEFKLTHTLYNLSPTAGNQLGIKRSEETKRRMSEALRGRRLSEESKQKMAAAKLGKKAAPETKAKMSAAHKGNRYAFGTRHSYETKAKLSLIRTGNKFAFRGFATPNKSKEQMWFPL